METIIRSYGAVIDDVDASDRTIVAKISAGEVDRYGTVIESRGINFANYRKNPVVLFEHGKSPVRGSVPIGRNVWIKQDNVGCGRVLAKTRFAEDEFSDLLFSFYKDGTMRGWSISVLPSEASPPAREEIRTRPDLKDCELIYRAGECLEYSAVSTPGLASALTEPELRSLSTLVVRGFWTPPEEIKPLVEPIVAELAGEDAGTDEDVRDEATDEAVDRSSDEESAEAEAPAGPAEKAAPKLDIIAELGALSVDELRRIGEEVRSLIPEPEPAPAPKPEVEPEPSEPEAPADPLANLPPLVARTYSEALEDRLKPADAWERSAQRLIDSLSEWFRGTA